jgi:hypothetical protein
MVGVCAAQSSAWGQLIDAGTDFQANPPIGITAYVFNSAQVKSADLIKAQLLAGRIFEKVGIQVTWVAGWMGNLTEPHVNDSQAQKQWNPASLVLRIWTSWMAKGTRINSDALGFCLSMKKNEAIVLSDTTQKNAAKWELDPVLYLGVAMAHEMGHLLLQSADHSVLGVMKAQLQREDLRAAERGTLTFNSEEGRSLRSQALRRLQTPMRQDAAQDPPSAGPSPQ